MHIILVCLLTGIFQARTTVSEVEEIIDRPFDPAITLKKWDLEEAVEQIAIATINPKDRLTLLKKFHKRSLQRAAERELSSKEQLMFYLYQGIFGISLFFTLKTALKIAMPGRYGRLGQGIDSIFGAAYLAAMIYSGIQVIEIFQKQQPLKAAQKRVSYFEQLLEN